MAQNNERNPHKVLIPIGSLGAGLSKEVPGTKMLRDAVILNAHVIDRLGVAQNGTDHVLIKLRDHTASLDIASVDTASGALVALEGKDLVLVPSVGDQYANPGDLVVDRGHSVSVSVASSGAAVLTDAVLVVELYYE